MAIKEIPSNMEAEQSVLGSMFLSPYALQKACDGLLQESFYYDNNGLIFSTIVDMYNKNIPIDATTVTSELKNKGILSQVGGRIFDIVIMNNGEVSEILKEKYIKKGAKPVENEKEKIIKMGYQVIEDDYIVVSEENQIRHNTDKIADIIEILAEIEKKERSNL